MSGVADAIKILGPRFRGESGKYFNDVQGDGGNDLQWKTHSRTQTPIYVVRFVELLERRMPVERKTPLPRFEIRPLSAEEGGGYLVEFPDYPGCIADGDTPQEAMREGADALASYIETLKALGRPIPATGGVYGGQWRQRVPKSLHAALARRAAREGVSLNMLVTTILAEGLGRRAGVEFR